jgi:hypothetical protein
LEWAASNLVRWPLPFSLPMENRDNQRLAVVGQADFLTTIRVAPFAGSCQSSMFLFVERTAAIVI